MRSLWRQGEDEVPFQRKIYPHLLQGEEVCRWGSEEKKEKVSFFRRYIKVWIDRLSVSHKETAGMPLCPFASKASVATAIVSDASELGQFLRCVSLDPWHVLVILIDFPDSEEIRKVLKIHKLHLAGKDLIALPSDPGHPNYIAGIRTTNEVYFLVLVQRKSEIERASQELRRKGYYSNWSRDQLAWLEDRE